MDPSKYQLLGLLLSVAFAIVTFTGLYVLSNRAARLGERLREAQTDIAQLVAILQCDRWKVVSRQMYHQTEHAHDDDSPVDYLALVRPSVEVSENAFVTGRHIRRALEKSGAKSGDTVAFWFERESGETASQLLGSLRCTVLARS